MDQHQTGIFSFSKVFFVLELSKDVAHTTALLCSCPAVKSDDTRVEARELKGCTALSSSYGSTSFTCQDCWRAKQAVRVSAVNSQLWVSQHGKTPDSSTASAEQLQLL